MYTDEQLIISLKRRDNHVVSYIFKKYMPMIKYMVKELKGKEEEAEDLFQEALIIIIKKIDSDELILTAKFSTYLYAICKNLLESRLKRKTVEEKYLIRKVETVFDEDFSEDYDKKYQYKMYKHYFAKLGESCQRILNMYWLDVPVKEIAKALNSTEGYVRKKKLECKERLIDLITANADNIGSD
jgi:RNA polymerase sigma factor (sigma-70 family)